MKPIKLKDLEVVYVTQAEKVLLRIEVEAPRIILVLGKNGGYSLYKKEDFEFEDEIRQLRREFFEPKAEIVNTTSGEYKVYTLKQEKFVALTNKLRALGKTIMTKF